MAGRTRDPDWQREWQDEAPPGNFPCSRRAEVTIEDPLARRKVFIIQTCCTWNYDDEWETSPDPGSPVLAFTTRERALEHLLARQALQPDVVLGIVEVEVEGDRETVTLTA
jgi:hypothetical protein